MRDTFRRSAVQCRKYDRSLSVGKSPLMGAGVSGYSGVTGSPTLTCPRRKTLAPYPKRKPGALPG